MGKCQGCGKEIYSDENMVMLNHELWETYFNKRDFYCDECIEDRIGRELCLLDLLDSNPLCNMMFLEYRKSIGRELKVSYGSLRKTNIR